MKRLMLCLLFALAMAPQASAKIDMQIFSPIPASYETTSIWFNWSYNETLNFSSYALDSNCNNLTDTEFVTYGSNITIYDPFGSDEDPLAWGNGTNCVTPENCTDGNYSTYCKGILPNACAIFENYTTYYTSNQPVFNYRIYGAGAAAPYWRAWCYNGTDDAIKFVEEYNWTLMTGSNYLSNGTTVPAQCVQHPKPIRIYTYQYMTPGWQSWMLESNMSWDVDSGNFTPGFTDDCIYTLTLYGNGSDGAMDSDSVTFSIDIPMPAGGSDPRLMPPGSIPQPEEGQPAQASEATSLSATGNMIKGNAKYVHDFIIGRIFTPIEDEAAFVRWELYFFAPLFYPFSPFHILALLASWYFPIKYTFRERKVPRANMMTAILVSAIVTYFTWAGIQNMLIL